MRPIPKPLLADMLADSFYWHCVYEHPDAPNHDCSGRLEFEHAWVIGKQVNEKWAIIRCCTNHNRGNAMVKSYNRYRALIRADIEDLKKRYPKRNWDQDLKYLKSLYDKNKTIKCK